MNIETLWTQFHTPLKRFVVNKVSDEHAAEDIVQDVFLKVLSSLDGLRDPEKVQAWLYHITRNTIIDYYRKKKITVELPADLMDENAGYEEENFSKELSKCVPQMLEDLPEKYREAILFTEINGRSQKELSNHTGMSFSGAKSRVQRGRQKLKLLITNCCHVEADKYGNIIHYHPRECMDEQNCQTS